MIGHTHLRHTETKIETHADRRNKRKKDRQKEHTERKKERRGDITNNRNLDRRTEQIKTTRRKQRRAADRHETKIVIGKSSKRQKDRQNRRQNKGNK